MNRALQLISIALIAGSVCLIVPLSMAIYLEPLHGPQAKPAFEIENTTESFYNSAVKIKGPRTGGSGLEGWFHGVYGVLTAAHVVQDNTPLAVVDENENGEDTRTAEVLLMDESKDLAFLKVAGLPRQGKPDLTPVERVKLGEEVWYAGYGAFTRCWLERSIISRPRWKEEDYAKFDGFLVTGKAFYGSSGSGAWVVRDGKARLAGVICRWASSRPNTYVWGPMACQGPLEVATFLVRVEIRSRGTN